MAGGHSLRPIICPSAFENGSWKDSDNSSKTKKNNMKKPLNLKVQLGAVFN